jgi:hypothetical protein
VDVEVVAGLPGDEAETLAVEVAGVPLGDEVVFKLCLCELHHTPDQHHGNNGENGMRRRKRRLHHPSR